MSDLHSQTLAPTASLVVTVATHVDTEQRCGGWSLQALETKFRVTCGLLFSCARNSVLEGASDR